MDGSGLFQVLVTLAVILLAIFALGRAYRKTSGNARGEGCPEAQDGARSEVRPEKPNAAPGHSRTDPDAFGLRHAEAPVEDAIGQTSGDSMPEAARPTPWQRGDIAGGEPSDPLPEESSVSEPTGPASRGEMGADGSA